MAEHHHSKIINPHNQRHCGIAQVFMIFVIVAWITQGPYMNHPSIINIIPLHFLPLCLYTPLLKLSCGLLTFM